MKSQRIIKWISFVITVGYVNFFVYSIVNCASTVDVEENLPKQNAIHNDDSYSYVTEGRSDPFKPFVSTQSAAPVGPDPNEVIETTEELSGMQLFEPGQLNLVGILLSPSGEMALVEDQAKKGYVLRVGTLIGKRGTVTEIASEQVTIIETAKTRAGKEVKNTLTMRLKKEGD
jgi:type IV pilus assembly protein PilP